MAIIMATTSMSLREYIRKRDFQKSAEPEALKAKNGGHRFVIQKHAASRLHYDFRLEIDGVLKSWAVPKGVPFTRGEKRLAVQVEDHPVGYINFEGTIPKGQYGGGTVMVWDKGNFSVLGKSPMNALESGRLHFQLDGKKLHGLWHLVRLRNGSQWLLIKSGDDMKPVSKKSEDASALSGKTMKQLSENGAVWESKPRNNGSSFAARLQKTGSRKKTAPVNFIEPMKARLADAPPVSRNWIYEIKFDGYRALAFKDGRTVTLLSRNEKDFGEKFPDVADAFAALDAHQAVIDGEIVALDKTGVSSFQLLQGFEIGEQRPPIYFYAFDLLQLNGKDLRKQTVIQRKDHLAAVLKKAPGIIRFSASLGENADKLLKRASKLGLEGLIGKRKDSIYEAGKRSGAWIKLKLNREQEFVIGGYSEPEGSRKHFGALLVGFFEKRKFKFCGKVGTGFNARLLAGLHSKFREIARGDCPFVNLPEAHGSRYSPRLTQAEMKKCHWLEPQLVCQVKFSEWTKDEKLRQPVFLGLREDKDAADVVREKSR
jgi:bifunctional non-homologous end joining protein LigD